MTIPITTIDVARDQEIAEAIVHNSFEPMKFILRANPGALGVYVTFVMFVSACQAADFDPMMEFLELMDVLEGVPPAVSRSYQ
jgi:hypothetical protein